MQKGKEEKKRKKESWNAIGKRRVFFWDEKIDVIFDHHHHICKEERGNCLIRSNMVE